MKIKQVVHMDEDLQIEITCHPQIKSIDGKIYYANDMDAVCKSCNSKIGIDIKSNSLKKISGYIEEHPYLACPYCNHKRIKLKEVRAFE